MKAIGSILGGGEAPKVPAIHQKSAQEIAEEEMRSKNDAQAAAADAAAVDSDRRRAGRGGMSTLLTGSLDDATLGTAKLKPKSTLGGA